MPVAIQGNPNTQPAGSYLEKDLGYSYPYELDLKPGSKVHEKIKTEVLSRARESHELVSNRFASWNEIERVLTAYIDLSESEKDVKTADKRKPVSIVFPYSYVIVETLLTYLIMAFLTDPIIKYEGTSPEDTIGAIMLEKVIQKQCIAFKVGLALHTFLRDSIVYGLGIGAPVWERKTGVVHKPNEYGGGGSTEESVKFEGNKLNNVDPYLYLPDPKVPSHRVQDGEYVGWIDPTTRMALLRKEKRSNNDIFNVRYLADMQLRRSSIFSSGESERNKKTGVDCYRTLTTGIHNPVDVIYMYVDLIPKEWELSTEEYPEKWLFGLANDEIVIQTKKLGLSHGMYPIVTASPDFDGYSILPLARTEVIYGMQELLDFQINSHTANTRKAVNDMFVVDPFLVNIEDLKEPNEGKIIRLRRPAWGKGVKDAVQQLAVNDITRANITDATFVIQWMQKIGGTDESLMGALRQGGPERLTGQEFQGTRAGAISRLERVAKVISMQAMYDLGYMFASHTQQLMENETYVKIAGRWQTELMEMFGGDVSKLRISPYDIMVDYDIEINDGSVPSGPSQMWIRMYDILSKNPALASKFDMVRVFEYIAHIMGAKNIQDFRINPKLMPDEKVNSEVKRGNVVPLSAVGGGQGFGV